MDFILIIQKYNRFMLIEIIMININQYKLYHYHIIIKKDFMN